MRYKLLVGLIYFFYGISTSNGLVFEDFCKSLDNWEFLDYKADGKVYLTKDHSCPEAYGPQVLHVEGGVVLGLARGAELTQGTLVVLYKENQPRKEDGDGVILFGAQYGQDVSQEHNTKIMRAHLWFEQDNDCGIQFRSIDAQGRETQLQERTGVGLVTDPWNRTGWIWQKVRIEGGMIKAKFWPAEQTEPEGWLLQGRYPLPGARFGLKINSGDIHVAYFAADTADIKPRMPRAHLFFPQARTTETNRISMTLFTNAQQASRESLTLTVYSEDRRVAQRQLDMEIKTGSRETQLILSAGRAEPAMNVIQISLSEPLPAGICRVELTSDSGVYNAQGIFTVARVTDEQQRFAEAGKQITRLGLALKEINHPSDRRAALQVVHDAACAHLERAQGLLAAGEIDAARHTFRFVTEALEELKGYRGDWLKERVPAWQIGHGPEKADAPDEKRQKEQRCLDFYSPRYCLRFGEARLEAQSLVMGRSYKVVIPWQVEGEKPDRDFDFLVQLKSPLGNRTVASARAGLTVPTSQWEPGEVYPQCVELNVLAEDAQKRPAQPLVLDETHHLLVTVTDPETQAHVLLGNPPGPHPDRVGAGFLVDTLYVSSTPLEIRDFRPEDSRVGNVRTERISLVNVGNRALTFDALFTVTTECERVTFEQAQSLEIPAQGKKEVTFTWTPRAVGTLNLQVRLMQEDVMRTESVRAVEIFPPPGYDLAVVKGVTVRHAERGFVTPLTVQVGKGNTAPISVKVLARGRVVGKARGRGERVKVNVEPWFGYYDVLVKLDGFSYDRRLIATVVEVRNGELLVNGEPFIVKGVNVHGMDSTSPERTASMMRIMIDLGFNAWRGDYPALWQVDLAYELNTFYTVLAPFSCKSTQTIFARQAGPPLSTARELSRLFVERYRASAGVLLWNSANEIQEENIDFLLAQYPVYKAYDPEKRPVHYANLYGQDLWQGQDVMGVNYYFGENQRAVDRQPLIERSVEMGKSHGIPTLFCEYNSYYGSIHSTGVEAMQDLFAWGVEKGGMSGGFLYMKGDSTSHPGVFDDG
jgi:hypothetical protein